MRSRRAASSRSRTASFASRSFHICSGSGGSFGAAGLEAEVFAAAAGTFGGRVLTATAGFAALAAGGFGPPEAGFGAPAAVAAPGATAPFAGAEALVAAGALPGALGAPEGAGPVAGEGADGRAPGGSA